MTSTTQVDRGIPPVHTKIWTARDVVSQTRYLLLAHAAEYAARVVAVAGEIEDGKWERADTALGELADYQAEHIRQMQGYYSLLVWMRASGSRTVRVTVDEAGEPVAAGVGEHG